MATLAATAQTVVPPPPPPLSDVPLVKIAARLRRTIARCLQSSHDNGEILQFCLIVSLENDPHGLASPNSGNNVILIKSSRVEVNSP